MDWDWHCKTSQAIFLPIVNRYSHDYTWTKGRFHALKSIIYPKSQVIFRPKTDKPNIKDSVKNALEEWEKMCKLAGRKLCNIGIKLQFCINIYYSTKCEFKLKFFARLSFNSIFAADGFDKETDIFFIDDFVCVSFRINKAIYTHPSVIWRQNCPLSPIQFKSTHPLQLTVWGNQLAGFMCSRWMWHSRIHTWHSELLRFSRVLIWYTCFWFKSAIYFRSESSPNILVLAYISCIP